MKFPKYRTRLVGLAAIAIAPMVVFAHTPAQAEAIQAVEPITLAPGFSPNPLEVKGTGGGSVSASSIVGRTDTPNGECTGYASRKPDQILVLRAFFNSLSLQAQSTEDTALVIQGPGGVWCNDDYDGKNPGIAGQWLPGTYKIWVSSYGKDRTPAYTIRIREQR